MRAFRRPLSRGVAVLLIAAAAALSGCAAAQMGNMWRDESFQATPMTNVLVVSLRADAVKRRLWEDAFAAGLATRGAKATPSYRLWANALPDTQQVIEAVRANGYDGVFVNMRPPDGQTQNLIPGYVKREAVTRQNPFTGAYYTVWRDVQVPERAEAIAVANFQTDVWTTKDGGRLVWSGSSMTTDALTASTIQTQVDNLLLPEVAKAGFLGGKQKK